jgi:hypothetical protein
MVSSSVVVDGSLMANCVRYDAVIEEPYPKTLSEPEGVNVRDNRQNLFCFHPQGPGFVWIGYSETWQQEPQLATQPTATTSRPSLIENYRRELEPFVGSIRFMTPTGP